MSKKSFQRTRKLNRLLGELQQHNGLIVRFIPTYSDDHYRSIQKAIGEAYNNPELNIEYDNACLVEEPFPEGGIVFIRLEISQRRGRGRSRKPIPINVSLIDMCVNELHFPTSQRWNL